MAPTVLLTLDRTEKDARAIAAAEAFAELAGADIHVIHVFGGIPGTGLEAMPDRAGGRHADASEWLTATCVRIQPPAGRAVTGGIVIGLGYADTILKEAESRGVEVIVMATRAAGVVGRVAFGSVADPVMRQSTRPVVLVPPDVDADRKDRRDLRRVLVPLDDSRDALRILSRTLSFARAHALHFVLFQAVGSGRYALPAPLPPFGALAPVPAEPEPLDVQLATAKTRLDAVAADVRLQGATADVLVVEAADPESAIVNAARSSSVDFIAMTTSGFGGITRWLAGSVATGVTRRSPVPVLVLAQ